MIRSGKITDLYDGGKYLRQWVIGADGQPRCVDDALLVAGIDQAAQDRQAAGNAGIKASIAAVEGYAAALEAAARPPPERNATFTGRDGQDVVVVTDEWQAWDAATTTVNTADAATVELHGKRVGVRG